MPIRRVRDSIALPLLLAIGCTAGFQTFGQNEKLPSLGGDGVSRPGKFIWADLVTDDLAATRRFYTRLFGWTFQESGNYAIAANDERPLAGIFERARPKDRPAQPRWIAYLSVNNVSKAQREVQNAGGKMLMPPQKLPDRGEQAVFADAEGAVFGVMKSSSGDQQDFLPDPGDWIWIQLVSRDAGKAAEFYQTVGGYEPITNNTARLTNSFVLATKGYARAAITTIPPQHSELKPTWLPFVRVKSVAESVDRAKELGGKILIAPQPELLTGRAAVIADPTGAAIGILEWSGAIAEGEQKP